MTSLADLQTIQIKNSKVCNKIQVTTNQLHLLSTRQQQQETEVGKLRKVETPTRGLGTCCGVWGVATFYCDVFRCLCVLDTVLSILAWCVQVPLELSAFLSQSVGVMSPEMRSSSDGVRDGCWVKRSRSDASSRVALLSDGCFLITVAEIWHVETRQPRGDGNTQLCTAADIKLWNWFISSLLMNSDWTSQFISVYIHNWRVKNINTRLGQTRFNLDDHLSQRFDF